MIMKRALLTEVEISTALSRLPGWEMQGKEICKTQVFKSYLEGIRFVDRLAEAAEAMNHHPDLFVGWRKVTVRLSTHSAGGVTALDVALAEEAERLAGLPG